jgi:hypothetical protein
MPSKIQQNFTIMDESEQARRWVSIRKRDGRNVPFQPEKIDMAILLAMKVIGQKLEN